MTPQPKDAPSVEHPYAEAATILLREKGLCGTVFYRDGEEVACVLPWPCEVHMLSIEDAIARQIECAVLERQNMPQVPESQTFYKRARRVLALVRAHAPTGLFAASTEDQSPSADALDDICALVGAPAWDYPGQVVRDVAKAIGMDMDTMRAKLVAARDNRTLLHGQRLRDLRLAIAYIREDIDIHESWKHYLETSPDEANDPVPQVETAGSVAHHQEWIARLEVVLTVLEAQRE
jgi:hypothetical protein